MSAGVGLYKCIALYFQVDYTSAQFTRASNGGISECKEFNILLFLNSPLPFDFLNALVLVAFTIAALTSLMCSYTPLISSRLLSFRSDSSSETVQSEDQEHDSIQEVQTGRGVCDVLGSRGSGDVQHGHRRHHLPLALQAPPQIRKS